MDHSPIYCYKFEDKVFNSIEAAQKEAEIIKKKRGESAPRRCT